MFYHIDILGIILATVAYMIVGWLWYSPFIFGKRWMKLMRMDAVSPDEMVVLKKSSNRAMILTGINALIMAFVLERVIYNVPLVTFGMTIALSVLLWIGLVATSCANEYIFSYKGKPWSVYLINQGNMIVTIIIMTIILYKF